MNNNLVYNTGKWIHINILGCDELIGHVNANSVFENSFFEAIKEIHHVYRVQFCLFFRSLDSIESLFCTNDVHRAELIENSDWLKLAYEQDSAENDNSVKLATQMLALYASISANIMGKIALLYNFHDSMLIDSLKDNGIKLLLCDDYNHSYDMELKNQEELIQKDITSIGGVVVRRFDLLWDNNVRDPVESLSYHLNKVAQRTTLEIGIYWHHILSDKRFIQETIKKIPSIPKNLFLNASFYDPAGILYFTTINTRFLYKSSNLDNPPKIIAELPSEFYSISRYSSMVLFFDELWMIPHFEKYIYVFNHKKRTLQQINVVEILGEGTNPRFRKAILKENYIYLLPRDGRYIMRIDAKAKSYRIYDNPFCSGTDENSGYLCISVDDKYVYFWGDTKNQNFRYSFSDDTLIKWEVDSKGGFGICLTDGRKLVIPTYERGNLFLLDDKDELIDQVPLPDDVWKDGVNEYYWYAEQIGDCVYILPQEADKLLVYCISTDTIRFVEWPQKHEYLSLGVNSFTGYDAWGQGSTAYITTHMGNHIMILDRFGYSIDIMDLTIPLAHLTYKECRKMISRETDVLPLDSFINSNQFIKTHLRID